MLLLFIPSLPQKDPWFLSPEYSFWDSSQPLLIKADEIF